MNYRDVDPRLRQLVGLRESMMRLGFPAKDLWVQRRTETGILLLILHPGPKEFALDAGMPWEPGLAGNDPTHRFVEQWVPVSRALRAGKINRLDLARMERETGHDLPSIMLALAARGIEIPAAQGETTLDCGFCSGKVVLLAGVEGRPGVIHSQPTCSKFDKSHPDDFVHALNERLRLQRGEVSHA